MGAIIKWRQLCYRFESIQVCLKTFKLHKLFLTSLNSNATQQKKKNLLNKIKIMAKEQNSGKWSETQQQQVSKKLLD